MGGFVMKRSAKYTTLIVVIFTIGIFGLIGGSSEIGGVTNDGEIKNIAIESRQAIFQNNFDIDISPHVISVDTGVLTIPTVLATDSTDATWDSFMPGNPVYNTWTITLASHPDNADIKDWVKNAVNGQDIRKIIELNYRSSPQESPIRTINCIDAFPMSYNSGDYSAGSGQVLVEKLVVKCGRIEIS